MNFLGIDIGSTNIKCRLSTDENITLFFAKRDYPTVQENQSSYIDVTRIYNELEHMITEASKQEDIDAICISSFGESFVLLDEHNKILLHPMLYTDPRGEVETKDVLKLTSKDEMYRITGTIPQSMYSLYKLLWFKKHSPNQFKQSRKFMQIADYMNYKITNFHVTDYSLAARTGVFNLDRKTFDLDLLKKLDVDPSIFPKVLKTGTCIGNISESFAKKCGLNPSCKVVIGGHDQVMAAIGSGVVKENMAIDGMGTVECITTTFKNKIDDIKLGIKGYAMVPFLDNYCTYMFNYTGGSLVKWVKQNIYQNKYSEKEMETLVLEKCQPGPSEILVLPYFAGAATPHQNIHARGSIVNLNIDNTSEDLYKAILEGLSYEMKFNLEMVIPYGIEVERMIVSGGGSSSNLWLSIKANIFNQEIYPLNDEESGIQGALMLCSVALNQCKTLEDAVSKFVSYKNPVSPNSYLTEKYKRHYEKYKNIYDAVFQFNKLGENNEC
jgi:xylulokinase